MSIFSKSFGKRGPLTTLMLLAGVAVAGLVSAFIETPLGRNDFLHEHLKVADTEMPLNWPASNFDLPEKDKIKILDILTKTERQFSTQDLNQILRGQALEDVKSNICLPTSALCKFSIRLNRQFSTVHLNRDMRVVNVQEKGLRVDLELLLKTGTIELKNLTDESRVLSFYQTQTGWIQNQFASIKADQLSFIPREILFRDRFEEKFVGINYYPASASWLDFWTIFPKDEIRADLEVAKDLNVNSLRIFLNHEYFNAEDTREDALSKLDVFLDMCEAMDLAVIITLFDLRPDYTLSNWDADIAHIDSVLSRIGPRHSVLGIDLKNQPDLDFENWGKGRVEAWLTVMARHIQTQYSHFPVTTGWSKAKAGIRLIDIFDFISYHEYENPKGLESRLRQVREAAGDKPVLITEVGSTIWHPPFIKSFQENKQAARLDDQLNQLYSANGVFVWTLHDFEDVSSDIVGPLPWRRAQQKHFGLMRSDGTLRPAGDILKSFGARIQQQDEKSSLGSNASQHSPL